MPRTPGTKGTVTAVALLLMTVSLVACGGDPAAPTTTAPPGFTVTSNAKEGFALAVPSEWTPIPLKQKISEFNEDANRLRLANPKLASILPQARKLAQSGGKFMAVTPDGTGSANLSVDKPKEKTLEEIVRNSIAGLESFGATNITQEPVAIDGKPAVRVAFRLPLETDAGTVPTDEIQHYLLDDGKAFILTVAATPPDVAAAIASSLRIR